MPDNAFRPQDFPGFFNSAEALSLMDQSAETERKWLERRREQQVAQAAPPPQTLPTPSLPNDNSDESARAKLRDAVFQYDQALLAVATAESNAKRSADRMAQADARLGTYGSLDERVNQHHLANIKSDRDDPLPPSVSAALAAR